MRELAELAHAWRLLGRVGLVECLGRAVLECRVHRAWEAGERVVVRARAVGARPEAVRALVKD